MKKRKRLTGRHIGMQAVSLCISTTMVLILLGLVVAFMLSARNLSTSVRENMSVNVVLGDTVSVGDGQQLATQLQQRPFARQVQYISAEEALAIMTVELGADPVEFAGVNPFLAEIKILLNADYANTDSLARLAQTLKTDSLVTDVYYAQDEINAADHNLNFVGLVLLVISALLIFICYTLISNSVQLGVYARRFEQDPMIPKPITEDSIVPLFARDQIHVIVLGDPQGSNVVQAWSQYSPHSVSIDKWR